MEPNMKKIILGVLLGVVLILGLGAGIFYWIKQELQEKSEVGKTENVVKNETELQKQAADIIGSKKMEACSQIADPTYRAVCKNNISLQLAQEKQDVSYCKNLDGKLMSVVSCEEEIVMKKALTEKNVESCKESSDQDLQKRCAQAFYINSAINENNKALCDKASDKEMQDICKDNYVFQKEFSLAEKRFECKKFLADDLKKDCELYKISNDSTQSCGNFKTSAFQQACLLNSSQANGDLNNLQ